MGRAESWGQAPVPPAVLTGTQPRGTPVGLPAGDGVPTALVDLLGRQDRRLMLIGVLTLVPVLCLLVFIYRQLSNHPLDPVALFCYFFGFFYLFRDILLSVHLDTPTPDYLFNSSHV